MSLLGRLFGRRREAVRESLAGPPDERAAAELGQRVRHGIELYGAGHWREALAVLAECREPARRLGGPGAEGRLLAHLAVVHRGLGETGEAERCFAAALSAARQTGDPTGEETALDALAELCTSGGRLDEAAAHSEQALALARRTGDRTREGKILARLGNLHHDRGDLAAAVRWYGEALPVLQQLGDRALGGAVAANRGVARRILGDLREALADLELAQALLRAAGRDAQQARALINLGEVHGALGEPDAALRAFGDALPLLDAGGDLRLAAETRVRMGELQQRLGRTLEGVRTLEVAADQARQSGARELEARAAAALGHLSFALADRAEARRWYGRALEIQQETGDRAGQGHSLFALGALLEPAEAAPLFARALAAARAAGDRASEGRALARLGASHAEMGRTDEALAELAQALAILRESGERREEAGALTHLALVHRDRGDLARACELGEEACRALEADAGAAAHDEVRSRLADESRIAFQELAATLLLRHRSDPDGGFAARALEVHERGRGRVLRDRIGGAAGAPPPALDAVQERLLGDGTILLEYALGSEESVLWVVSADAWEVYALPPAGEIRRTVLDLIVELVAKQGAGDYTRPAAELHRLLLQPAEPFLRRRLATTALRRLLVVPDFGLDFVPFEMLLPESPLVSPTPSAAPGQDQAEPIAGRGTPRDLLSTAAPPPAPAPADLPWLVRDVAVVYAPSLAVLADLRRRRAAVPGEELPREYMGFAPVELRSAPPLRHSEREVVETAALFPPGKAAVRLRAEASRRGVASADLAGCRFLHFATHGQADTEVPSLCGLLLAGDAEDSLLSLPEILRLDLRADLVALSSCQSGLGKQSRGEGVLGLPRAFLAAGAASVCFSLWEVWDDSTAELMIRFFRHLAHDGADRGEALRRAKLELIVGGRWAAPYHWAPFVLTGDWRPTASSGDNGRARRS